MSYRSVCVDGRIVKEHIAVAERVLGKRLPDGAVVHHIDGDKRNNQTSNLVICPSQAYHKMLHMRDASIINTGSPDNLPCHMCGVWDAKTNLYFRLPPYRGQWHRECANQKRKERRARNG